MKTYYPESGLIENEEIGYSKSDNLLVKERKLNSIIHSPCNIKPGMNPYFLDK
jgi:hypothetical protein